MVWTTPWGLSVKLRSPTHAPSALNTVTLTVVWKSAKLPSPTLVRKDVFLVSWISRTSSPVPIASPSEFPGMYCP